MKNSDIAKLSRCHAEQVSYVARQVRLIGVAELGCDCGELTARTNRLACCAHPLNAQKRLGTEAEPASARALEQTLTRGRRTRQSQSACRGARLLDKVCDDARLPFVRFDRIGDERLEVVRALDGEALGGADQVGLLHKGRSKPGTEANPNVAVTGLDVGAMRASNR